MKKNKTNVYMNKYMKKKQINELPNQYINK